MSKGLMVKIVAGLLVLVVGGALVYRTADEDDSRKAALGGQGQGPPADVAEDVERIRERKQAGGTPPAGRAGAVKKAGPAQNPPKLDTNPQGVCDPDLPPNVEIFWAKRPRNLNEAKGLSTQIIVGTVTDIEAAPPAVDEVPGEPGGKVVTPVQKITLKVDDTIRGNAKEGGTASIVKAGDAEGCYRVDGDPPYQRGEQYLLLLEESGGGHPPHTISPAGRFRVGTDQALRAFERNPVASEVAGQKLETVVARLRG